MPSNDKKKWCPGPAEPVEEMLRYYLNEDVGQGDITSELLVPDKSATAIIYSKDSGMVAGVEVVERLFGLLGCSVIQRMNNGEFVAPGDKICTLEGNMRALLLGERVALNILSRMCGVATLTNRFLKKARKVNSNIRVAATRKTTPGFRYFEKRAVKIGGGDPHRNSLDDMILIKENHIALAGGIKNALKRAKNGASFSKKIDVEVETFKQFKVALEQEADIIMLDNMSMQEVAECREYMDIPGHNNHNSRSGKTLLEVSGNISLDNIDLYAPMADIISVGALTYSYTSLDISMLVEREE